MTFPIKIQVNESHLTDAKEYLVVKQGLLLFHCKEQQT